MTTAPRRQSNKVIMSNISSPLINYCLPIFCFNRYLLSNPKKLLLTLLRIKIINFVDYLKLFTVRYSLFQSIVTVFGEVMPDACTLHIEATRTP
jgi:hypothetical protein